MSGLRDPAVRIRTAQTALAVCLVGWPSTHVLMVVTHPPEASWVFHLLLALSWLAIIYTAVDVLATTDVRREQEGEITSEH